VKILGKISPFCGIG